LSSPKDLIFLKRRSVLRQPYKQLSYLDLKCPANFPEARSGRERTLQGYRDCFRIADYPRVKSDSSLIWWERAAAGGFALWGDHAGPPSSHWLSEELLHLGAVMPGLSQAGIPAVVCWISRRRLASPCQSWIVSGSRDRSQGCRLCRLPVVGLHPPCSRIEKLRRCWLPCYIHVALHCLCQLRIHFVRNGHNIGQQQTEVQRTQILLQRPKERYLEYS